MVRIGRAAVSVAMEALIVLEEESG